MYQPPQRHRQQFSPMRTPVRQPPAAPPPEPPRRRTCNKFRLGWIAVPLVLLLGMWLLTGAEAPALTFDDVMDFLHVRHRREYRQLATLGLIAVGIVWIMKVLKSEDTGCGRSRID